MTPGNVAGSTDGGDVGGNTGDAEEASVAGDTADAGETDVAANTADAEEPDVAELAAEVDLLAAENRRLRRQYERARHAQYRRTALGLVALGLLAVAGGAAFPGARTVLLVLGATGLFAGLLTFYLTPEQFIPARVGEQVYSALAANEAAMAADLGLADHRVYVPTGDPDEPVWLFVPQHEHYAVPDADALADVFVVTDDERARGVSLEPTGRVLFDEFERALAGPPGEDPERIATQLADALVEQFELVDSTRVSSDSDGTDGPGESGGDRAGDEGGERDDGAVGDQVGEREPTGRVTVAVAGSAYGAIDRFDHPVASLLAVGVARAVGTPVTVAVTGGGDRSDYAVTCRWSGPIGADRSQ